MKNTISTVPLRNQSLTFYCWVCLYVFVSAHCHLEGRLVVVCISEVNGFIDGTCWPAWQHSSFQSPPIYTRTHIYIYIYIVYTYISDQRQCLLFFVIGITFAFSPPHTHTSTQLIWYQPIWIDRRFFKSFSIDCFLITRGMSSSAELTAFENTDVARRHHQARNDAMGGWGVNWYTLFWSYFLGHNASVVHTYIWGTRFGGGCTSLVTMHIWWKKAVDCVSKK